MLLELMSRGLWTEASDQIWNGIRKVDLRPNYGDSGCLELKAGDGEGASGSSTDEAFLMLGSIATHVDNACTPKLPTVTLRHRLDSKALRTAEYAPAVGPPLPCPKVFSKKTLDASTFFFLYFRNWAAQPGRIFR